MYRKCGNPNTNTICSQPVLFLFVSLCISFHYIIGKQTRYMLWWYGPANDLFGNAQMSYNYSIPTRNVLYYRTLINKIDKSNCGRQNTIVVNLIR